jgi:hypothetical protein
MSGSRWYGMLLAAACGMSMAAKPDTSTDLWLQARITIDAEGRVTDLAWDARTKLHTLIAERVTPRVKTWEFIPAAVDGRPAVTQTGLLIHLRAEDRADGSATLRLVDTKTGPMGVRTQPPAYPIEAMRANVSAKVVVEVSVAANGKAVLHGMQVSPSGKSYRKQFLAASEEALKAWSFYPEVVGGQSVPTIVTIPVMFCMEPSAWCARQREQDAVAKKDDLPSDLYVATKSAVALKTDVRESDI